MSRACFKCGSPIHACMGFVKAGDLLECCAGSRAKEEIRELCGLCAIPMLLFESDEELEDYSSRPEPPAPEEIEKFNTRYRYELEGERCESRT